MFLILLRTLSLIIIFFFTRFLYLPFLVCAPGSKVLTNIRLMTTEPKSLSLKPTLTIASSNESVDPSQPFLTYVPFAKSIVTFTKRIFLNFFMELIHFMRVLNVEIKSIHFFLHKFLSIIKYSCD